MRVPALPLVLLLSATLSAAAAHALGNLEFNKSKMVVVVDGKSKELPATVKWGSDAVSITWYTYGIYEVVPCDSVTIPYRKMSNLTYEYTTSRRVAAALLVSPLMLFSKRKSHWVSFDFYDQGHHKDNVTLRIDKSEVQAYKKMVPARCGLDLKVLEE